jgi:hypothetical protein
MRVPGLALVCCLAACGGNTTPPSPDAGVPISTDNCTYEPMTPTANSGGAVAAGALMAGAAERVLDVPVGTALGGYTARAGFLGSAGVVDTRKVAISGTFNPSIGVTTAPRAKALALSAGGETVVIVKVDTIFAFDNMLFDLEARLGPQFAGKVIFASSHSHSAWAQYTGNGAIKLGSGQQRNIVYTRFLDAMEGAARDALAAMQPAKIGVSFDGNFDPMNVVNHDRRGENDMLPGGNKKDDHLYLIRVDATDGTPIAAVPIFGEHGTLNSEDNPFASTDAPGALERVFQEQFGSKVVVMHMQSAGGDNSPSGHGGIDCNVKPGASGDPCLSWATEEGHGRAAVDLIMAAYTAAGAAMRDTVELEMMTRAVETGPFPDTFKIRDGGLVYAPFDLSKKPDGQVYDQTGAILSPIDEFNAPVGAGLCQSQDAMFPAAAIDGDDGILPYGSCLRLDVAGDILGQIFQIDFKLDASHPICETTRTTISALRIGDYVIGTMPGELTVMLATYLRSKSPLDEAHTILVGYSQGHVGYMLRPEDWLMGGYEPSITFWGPLESEYIGEQLLQLMPLALMSTRQDGTTSTQRLVSPVETDMLDVDDPAPMKGTIPATIPAEAWARTGHPTQAQPPAQIPRVSGIATFVWIGDDPQTRTPHVTLEVETTPNTFVPVTRKSSRIVDDAEVTIAYTPSPLQRSGPQTHIWVAEWQAVPWLGATGLDSLDDRGGVPLGRYRFHVDGKDWSLDSQPFEVIAGGLEAGAARTGGMIHAVASWHAAKGWRLMDMVAPSNQPVPVRNQAMKIELMMGSTVVATATPTTDGNGSITVADNASATSVRLTDRFGNVATASLP